MPDDGEKKSGRSTVIYRPAPPRPEEAGGFRILGYLAFALFAVVAYAGGVAWLAHRERTEADAKVRTLPSLALASFGAANEGGTGDRLLLPDPARAGGEMRAMVEERLRRVKGKSFTSAVAPPSAWDPLKPSPVQGFLAIPAGTRTLDFHDMPTCVALRAMHGVDDFLSVLVTFSLGTQAGPVAIVRVEAAVYGKDAKLVWTDVFTESQGWSGAPPPADPRLPDPLFLALRSAMFRASDRLGDALEPAAETK